MAPPDDLVTASHILVSFHGAERSASSRTKDEARERATELLGRLRQGEDFGRLAIAHSDDGASRVNRGSLGTLPARSWVDPFAQAVRALGPGEVSELIETPFGFHIIKRHP